MKPHSLSSKSILQIRQHGHCRGSSCFPCGSSPGMLGNSHTMTTAALAKLCTAVQGTCNSRESFSESLLGLARKQPARIRTA